MKIDPSLERAAMVNRRAVSRATRLMMAQLYRKGWTIRRVALEFECSSMLVWRALCVEGVQRRPPRSQGIGKCVDCGIESGTALRCEFHRRVREADLETDRRRQRKASRPGRKKNGNRERALF